MCDVYEARHSVTDEPVAVKVLSQRWCVHAEVVARFLNEAQTLQALQHPRLVKGLASGILSDGPPFMVLEWLPVNLHQALARAGGRLPERACARLIRQLAQGLAALHSQGLVHRDLKPANVLLTRQEPELWDAKLADLGLAKRMHQEGTGPSALPVSTAGGALLGTWDYMAPEQWASSKHVDFRVDVYALGILWFQLLAGRLPFIGDEQHSLMSCHAFKDPPLKLLEDLAPEATRAMVARMLAKTASKRPTLDDILAVVSTEEG
jgi:serine/threonine-protein kinase